MQVTNHEWPDVVIVGLIVSVFCIVGLVTLSHYGLTFDETWHFFAGERYLRFWATLDRSLLDFSTPHPADNGPDGHPLFDRCDNEPRPAIANTLSALSCRVFFDKLGWFDPVDAHHLPIVLMAGGTLAVVYLLGRETIGQRAAIFSSLALGLSPRFIAHSHFNIKDIPKTFFFSLTIWAFWKATTHRSWRWMVGSAVLFGLALGTRINAVLIPLIVGPWLAAVLLTFDDSQPSATPSWWEALVATPLVAGITWIVTWPPMLVAPMETLRSFMNHWRFIGFGAYSLPSWSPYALIYIAIVTPPVVLIFSCLGALVAVRELGGDARRGNLLLLLWFSIPLLRTALPNATNYDGIRQFIEFLPAFCLLGGLGAQRTMEALEARFHRHLPPRIAAALIGCAFLPLLVRVIQIHPYELVYFNWFVGGVSGARQLNLPDATDYWGSSHRQGMAWLNANAEPRARLYVSEGNSKMVKPVTNTWLRDDIDLLNGLDGRTSTPVYVSHITRQAFYDEVDHYCEENLVPVHSIYVDGVSILNIFRIDASDWTETVQHLEENSS